MSNPKVLVIGENLGKYKATDRPQHRDFMTGIEAWVYAFEGEFCNIFDCTLEHINKFDIVIGNTDFPGKYQDKLIELCHGRAAGVKWVSLIEGCAKEYLKPMKHIKNILDASDLVNVINKHSLPLFRSMTDTKSEYIGVPYPVENVYKLRKDIKDRKKEVFIAPMLLKRWNDHLVAKASGLSYFGIEEREHRTLKNIPKMLKKYGTLNGNIRMEMAKEYYKDQDLTVKRAYSLKEYFHKLSSTYFWVNLDERYTWARYILDAAVLGIPVITTKSTGHGETFFPELTLANEFETEKAIELAKRLAIDEDFYKSNANVDISKLEEFSYKSMKDKMLSHLF